MPFLIIDRQFVFRRQFFNLLSFGDSVIILSAYDLFFKIFKTLPLKIKGRTNMLCPYIVHLSVNDKKKQTYNFATVPPYSALLVTNKIS
jgi:hypothetical protein